MPVSRRKALIFGGVAPFFASCAANRGHHSPQSATELVKETGLCEAQYVGLKTGLPQTPVVLANCSSGLARGSAVIFQAASLSKPVVAFAALKLVREGELNLDASVAHYLPNGYEHVQNPFDHKTKKLIDTVAASSLARIPVRTLLNHSSGLPNWARGPLHVELIPGERWRYSGEGYVLLQAIIRAITQQDLNTFMTRAVFAPIGMHNSRMQLTDDIRSLVVKGTSSAGRPITFDLLEPNAASSLYTTAMDYAAFMAAFFADTALLKLTTVRQIEVRRELGLFWGLGWGVEQADGGPYLWQWGNNPGFRAFAMMSVSTGDGFVMLTNSEKGMPLIAPLMRLTVPAEHGVLRFEGVG